MAKIECYNCKNTTAVVAPHYRCKFCNYPLNKYLEDNKKDEGTLLEKVKVENNEPLDINQLNKGISSINELYQEKVPQLEKNINQILDRLPTDLKPDEKIKKSVTGTVIVKQNKNPEKNGKIVAGWLVVHTENKTPVTYELFEGNNIIGRPDGPHQVDVRIEDDEYVSRIHSIITVSKDFLHRFRYELTDDGKLRNGTPSTNGTYINGNTQRLPATKSAFIVDGDTIQVGTTKLVFKDTNNVNDDVSAFSSVNDLDYTQTVAIKK